MDQEIDDLLGDYHQRYFGTGYKKIRHSILVFEKSNDGWRGKAKVSQLRNWSVKKGKSLKQHLSSIDALVISVLFSSKVIKSIYPEVKVSEMILSGFTLAMGSTPVTELNNVDVCLRVVSHSENHYFVRGNVENMRVQLTFYYSCAGKEQSNQGTGKQGDESFFENQYRSLTNIINQIKFESDTVVDCCISIVPESELGDYDDIEGDYSQSVSLLSWLIIFAQIAEVDAYHFDHIKRNESANFWARKITATVNVQKLYHLKSKINVRLEIKKAKLLKMHDQNWRTLSVSAYDANHFVEFTGKMAHQLLKENL